MENNKLKIIEDGAFDNLVALETIRLHSNLLEYFPAMPALDKVKGIDLRDNLLKSLAVNATGSLDQTTFRDL